MTESQFLEAPLVRQADGELKNPTHLRQLSCIVSNCAFSSNLFHRHLAQIYIDQLSDPENKKCSPWKVFGTNHPQILRFLSRRGPGTVSRLHLPKKFPGLTKEISCTYWMNVEVLHIIFANYNPQKCIKMCRSFFVEPENCRKKQRGVSPIV